ncbi:MAG: fibrobacter succinogenes major paralogous domain-containing protein [Saprospiraceae bacterium]|nr:fibrobacter succinogenes major paralogous domain-containing protein [Saprospiraceae bacterium]
MKSGINVKIIIFFAILFLYSCTDSDDVIKKFETGTVSDIEGNQYITVKIGDQWWMQEDLKVTKLRTGQSIPFFGEFDNELWSKTELPAYCTGETGHLYNFYAIQSNTIAPEGWHVATDEDWKKLESFLGMDPKELDGINWREVMEKAINSNRIIRNPDGSHMKTTGVTMKADLMHLPVDADCLMEESVVLRKQNKVLVDLYFF